MAARLTIKLKAHMGLSPDAIKRAKAMLHGAPKRVKQHRVSVGIHEQEASAQAVKPGSGKPKPNRAKIDYRGKVHDALSSETGRAVYLIDVALVQEYGTNRLPERSWLRSWFDQHVETLGREATEAMRAEYQGDPDAVPTLAAKWYSELREWIRNDEAGLAPLAEQTRRQRTAAGLPEGPPLYATGQLVRAIGGRCDGRPV